MLSPTIEFLGTKGWANQTFASADDKNATGKIGISLLKLNIYPIFPYIDHCSKTMFRFFINKFGLDLAPCAANILNI